MKWLFLSFAPAIYCVATNTEVTGNVAEVGGFFMVFCFMALFAEHETVDAKALDKAGEIVTGGQCKYDSGKTQGGMLLVGLLVVGVHALLTQGGIFTEGIFAGLVIGGYTLGVWLSPEPSEADVQRYVDELKERKAREYMTELKKSDPERYREELGRLKAMEAHGMGRLPDDLEADCQRLGVTAGDSPLLGLMQGGEDA